MKVLFRCFLTEISEHCHISIEKWDRNQMLFFTKKSCCDFSRTRCVVWVRFIVAKRCHVTITDAQILAHSFRYYPEALAAPRWQKDRWTSVQSLTPHLNVAEEHHWTLAVKYFFAVLYCHIAQHSQCKTKESASVPSHLRVKLCGKWIEKCWTCCNSDIKKQKGWNVTKEKACGLADTSPSVTQSRYPNCTLWSL